LPTWEFDYFLRDKQMALLEVKNLRTWFHTYRGIVRAVDGIDFQVKRDQILGLVGESGCGKSVTSLSIMGLIPMPPGRVEGEILFANRDGGKIDLLRLHPESKQMRQIRGNQISMIFQEPLTAFNPVFTIGNQITEPLITHKKMSKREAYEKGIQMLKEVGIPIPELRMEEYPHQLSGGMRQRAMIAMALTCQPAVLIADEPTTALDVTIQAQILRLIKELQSEYRMSILLVTHDLGIIAKHASEVIVMYLGKQVEHAQTKEVFENPLHPYTKALLKAIPSIRRKRVLEPLKGTVMTPWGDIWEKRCAFAPRCPEVMDICEKEEPSIVEATQGHQARCLLCK
jgi:oligopeptide/dipeptide ABC transporter ATP-binding protein